MVAICVGAMVVVGRAAVPCLVVSRLYLTLLSALSSSEKSGFAELPSCESIEPWPRLLAQGAEPATASTSSSLPGCGEAYLPESRRARFRRCEKKLSLWLLCGEAGLC